MVFILKLILSFFYWIWWFLSVTRSRVYPFKERNTLESSMMWLICSVFLMVWICSVFDGYVSVNLWWVNDLKFFCRWYGMRLERVTMIETICCFNLSKSALTFITERLRKPESTKLTWISYWLMLNLKSAILLLLLGIACRSLGYVPLTSCFVLLLLLWPCHL